MLYDFFIKELPAMIVKAIKDLATAPFRAVGGVFNEEVTARLVERLNGAWRGGEVIRSGPIRVGERGEEVIYANRGEYIQSNSELGGDRYTFNVNGNVYGVDDLERHFVEFQHRVVGARQLAGSRH